MKFYENKRGLTFPGKYNCYLPFIIQSPAGSHPVVMNLTISREKETSAFTKNQDKANNMLHNLIILSEKPTCCHKFKSHSYGHYYAATLQKSSFIALWLCITNLKALSCFIHTNIEIRGFHDTIKTIILPCLCQMTS